MEELIKVDYTDCTRPTVSARDLHDFLEVETPYAKWFGRMCDYGFTDGVDFSTVDKNVLRTDGALMPQTQHDHQLTIDMAKELCMIQRTDKGKQARQYFIQLEKQWNDPAQVMARALKVADQTIAQLTADNSRLTVSNTVMAPKAEYFDELVDRNLTTNFRDTAKEFGMKQKAFINFLIEKKFIYRDKRGNLKPYAGHEDLFVIKESMNDKTKWAGTQTLITPKGRETFRLLCQGM